MTDFDSVCDSFSALMKEKTGIKWFVGYTTQDNVSLSFYFISENDLLSIWNLTRNRIKEKYCDLGACVRGEVSILVKSWQSRQRLMEEFSDDWQSFREYVTKIYKIAQSGHFGWQLKEVREAGRIFREKELGRKRDGECQGW